MEPKTEQNNQLIQSLLPRRLGLLSGLVTMVISVIAVLILWATGVVTPGTDNPEVTHHCTMANDGNGTCIFHNTGKTDDSRWCVTLTIRRIVASGGEFEKKRLCSGPLAAGEIAERSFSMKFWENCLFMDKVYKEKQCAFVEE